MIFIGFGQKNVLIGFHGHYIDFKMEYNKIIIFIMGLNDVLKIFEVIKN